MSYPYTLQEREFLADHSGEYNIHELVFELESRFSTHRTVKGLRDYLKRNGLSMKAIPLGSWVESTFNKEEKAFICEMAPIMKRKDLTELFNLVFNRQVPYNTIRVNCNKWGLSSPNGDGKFTSETSSRWQKGLSKEEFKSHYTEESYQRMWKNACDSNVKWHIGDEIIRHGKPYIIINEEFGHGIDNRIMPKNRYIWEQTYGKLKDDEMIICMDGDDFNCDLKNLRCVPTKYRAYLMHNDWWNASKEIKELALNWIELHYAVEEAKRNKV